MLNALDLLRIRRRDGARERRFVASDIAMPVALQDHLARDFARDRAGVEG